MICPKCSVEMVPGIAIQPAWADSNIRWIVAPDPLLMPKEMRLIDCFKCPKCGYSDDGKQ